MSADTWPTVTERQFRDRLAEFVDFVGLAQNGKIAAHVQRGVAVAAGQQDRQSGPDRLQVARQAEAVHLAGHHDVGEDEIYSVELDFAQGRFGVRHPADGVAELFEQAGADGCDIRIVLDQQHGAASAGFGAPGSSRRGRCFLARQQDRDPGALAEFARHLDRSAGLMREAVNLRQSQARCPCRSAWW